ncbi:MAG: hypothetical protein KF729_14665 [Sandaracinaceae bacterium]|nr:hypothetical protein [Sandaracinaceae bacterium]
MLRALAPRSSDIEFRGVQGGHGDGANAGFLRDDAVLAILFVNGHRECSMADLSHLELGAPSCDDGFVCCEERLLPVDRYVHGLTSLGRRRVVVSAITGVPGDVRPEAGDREALDAVLARPEMEVSGGRPFCHHVVSSPRHVQLVRACPGLLRSMCDRRLSERGGAEQIMGEIGRAIARAACHPE